MSQSKSKGKRAPTRKKRSPWPIVMLLGGLALVAAVIIGNLVYQPDQQAEDTGPGTPSLAIADIKSSPDAQIDGLKVDFGDMKLGAELATLTLTVANSGDKALNFTQAPYIQLADGC
jgi:hypothetical protein